MDPAYASDPAYQEAYKQASEIVEAQRRATFSRIKELDELEKKVVADVDDLAEYCASADARSTVILAVSFAEDCLKETFSVRWNIPNDDRDKFFGPNGPLNSFAQRSLVARSLYWLNDGAFADLEKLRRIRNEFAHNHRVRDFSGEPVRGLTQAIETRDFIMHVDDRPEYKQALERADHNQLSSMKIFCSSMFIGAEVIACSKRISFGYPPAWHGDGSAEWMLDFETSVISASLLYCWQCLGLTGDPPTPE